MDEVPETAVLEADIERTRHELGETVEPLAEKVDVKAQAKTKVAELTEEVRRRPAPFATGAAGVLGLLTVRRVWKRRRRARKTGQAD